MMKTFDSSYFKNVERSNVAMLNEHQTTIRIVACLLFSNKIQKNNSFQIILLVFSLLIYT
jgi:hypothetical protein